VFSANVAHALSHHRCVARDNRGCLSDRSRYGGVRGHADRCSADDGGRCCRSGDRRCRRAVGVAGGELLIPTLILLFGADIKLAGSLSLAVSLPTMLVGFARYSRDRSFVVLGENRRFVLVMAAGSIFGSFIGGQLLGLVPNAVLMPLLAIILVLSAVKVWKHK
jgi:hypothetical protein